MEWVVGTGLVNADGSALLWCTMFIIKVLAATGVPPKNTAVTLWIEQSSPLKTSAVMNRKLRMIPASCFNLAITQHSNFHNLKYLLLGWECPSDEQGRGQTECEIHQKTHPQPPLACLSLVFTSVPLALSPYLPLISAAHHRPASLSPKKSPWHNLIPDIQLQRIDIVIVYYD